MNDRCCVCGLQVPEGIQVCPACIKEFEEVMEQRKEGKA